MTRPMRLLGLRLLHPFVVTRDLIGRAHHPSLICTGTGTGTFSALAHILTCIPSRHRAYILARTRLVVHACAVAEGNDIKYIAGITRAYWKTQHKTFQASRCDHGGCRMGHGEPGPLQWTDRRILRRYWLMSHRVCRCIVSHCCGISSCQHPDPFVHDVSNYATRHVRVHLICARYMRIFVRK